MNKTLCLIAGFIVLPLLTPASAAENSFPEKNPVLSYATPAGWKTEVDAKDGSISISPADGRIAVNFAAVAVEASMDVFQKMLPAMVKTLKEPAEAEKPKEHTEDGLTGYTATYAAKIEDKPGVCIFVLFKGGKDRSVLGSIVVSDPSTLSPEDSAALESFMKSMKGAAPAATAGKSGQSFPEKNPVLNYQTPEKWKTEVDPKSGGVTVESADGRLAVNFVSIPVEASMEVFEKMLPAMVKELKDAKEAKKPSEHSEDGLTGFMATYSATIENKPAACIFILFKGGKEHSVLASVVMGDPQTLPAEDNEAMGKFMNSMKGAAK